MLSSVMAIWYYIWGTRKAGGCVPCWCVCVFERVRACDGNLLAKQWLWIRVQLVGNDSTFAFCLFFIAARVYILFERKLLSVTEKWIYSRVQAYRVWAGRIYRMSVGALVRQCVLEMWSEFSAWAKRYTSRLRQRQTKHQRRSSMMGRKLTAVHLFRLDKRGNTTLAHMSHIANGDWIHKILCLCFCYIDGPSALLSDRHTELGSYIIRTIPRYYIWWVFCLYIYLHNIFQTVFVFYNALILQIDTSSSS